jgi:hypothetical protein
MLLVHTPDFTVTASQTRVAVGQRELLRRHRCDTSGVTAVTPRKCEKPLTLLAL